MPNIICPGCNEARNVQARKPWMQGEEPYSHLCKRCCQVGKEKTDEHKKKLSQAVKAIQTEEVRRRKSEFMKLHPELLINLEAGKGAGWNKGQTTGPRDDATKEKISDTMKKIKGKGK